MVTMAGFPLVTKIKKDRKHLSGAAEFVGLLRWLCYSDVFVTWLIL